MLRMEEKRHTNTTFAYSATKVDTNIYVQNNFCGVLRLQEHQNHFLLSVFFFFSYSSLILTIRSKLPFQSKGIRLFMCDTWTWMICCSLRQSRRGGRQRVQFQKQRCFWNNKCFAFEWWNVNTYNQNEYTKVCTTPLDRSN